MVHCLQASDLVVGFDMTCAAGAEEGMEALGWEWGMVRHPFWGEAKEAAGSCVSLS